MSVRVRRLRIGEIETLVPNKPYRDLLKPLDSSLNLPEPA